jgi:aspartyl-tRNA(Asn)/glutamyl-tRNA(Gln) amidotransferase subunit B
MNSFRGVERALSAEFERQLELVGSGGEVVQETLLWDEKEETVRPMRSKEYAHDYRYFPEPDLVTVVVSPEWIEQIKLTQSELPEQRLARLRDEYGLSDYDASVIIQEKDWADYFEQTVKLGAEPKWGANWLTGQVLAVLRDKKMDIRDFAVKPDHLASLHKLIDDGTISGKIAKTVFQELAESGGDPETIIRDKGLLQISDQDSLKTLVEQVLVENPDEVERYRAGETKLKAFFVGQVMRLTKGKANPQMANQLLDQELGQSG